MLTRQVKSNQQSSTAFGATLNPKRSLLIDANSECRTTRAHADSSFFSIELSSHDLGRKWAVHSDPVQRSCLTASKDEGGGASFPPIARFVPSAAARRAGIPPPFEPHDAWPALATVDDPFHDDWPHWDLAPGHEPPTTPHSHTQEAQI